MNMPTSPKCTSITLTSFLSSGSICLDAYLSIPPQISHRHLKLNMYKLDLSSLLCFIIVSIYCFVSHYKNNMFQLFRPEIWEVILYFSIHFMFHIQLKSTAYLQHKYLCNALSFLYPHSCHTQSGPTSFISKTITIIFS